jgi:hypothetical protein
MSEAPYLNGIADFEAGNRLADLSVRLVRVEDRLDRLIAHERNRRKWNADPSKDEITATFR